MSKSIIIFFVLLIICLGVFFCTGFFVIQPIGMLPDGVTIWYFRLGLNMPFISSADGLSLKHLGKVSLFSRMEAMSSVMGEIKDKIIFRLPYQKWMYSISTGGQEFSN